MRLAISTSPMRKGEVSGGCTPRSRSRVALIDQPQTAEREQRIDLVDRLAVRRDRVRQPAGGDEGGLFVELVREAAVDPVDQSGEAVREARLDGRGGVLADRALGCGEIDARQLGRPRREGLQRDLDTGTDDTAEVFARTGDDVEVGRGAEVDRDAGPSHLRVRGHRVDQPVRTELVRVVDQDRHPVFRVGPTSRQRLPVWRSVRCSYSGPSWGTTVETIAPSSDPKLRPSSESRSEIVAASSSAVALGTVVSRQSQARSSPSKAPRWVWVLPTSTASSIRVIIQAPIG